MLLLFFNETVIMKYIHDTGLWLYISIANKISELEKTILLLTYVNKVNTLLLTYVLLTQVRLILNFFFFLKIYKPLN
jgi:hypothetical protein